MNSSYPSPVDKLLAFGDCRKFRHWPDYLALGFGPEHIDDLIRMTTDEALNTAQSDTLDVWAPIHALRTLGQLRAEAAIQPLLELFDSTEPDDNYLVIAFSEVMGKIGPAAIPALTAFLADPAHGLYPRTYAGDSLAKIGEQHPEAREECIRSIVATLENFEENAAELNGFLIANMLDLDAIEAAPVIERAFAADRVDESIAGDWEDVQINLGLIESRKSKRRNSILDRLFSSDQKDAGVWDDDEGEVGDFTIAPTGNVQNPHSQRSQAGKLKLKNRRAMARKSRRINRKKRKKK